MSFATSRKFLAAVVACMLLAGCSYGNAVGPQVPVQSDATVWNAATPLAGYKSIFSFDGKKDGQAPLGALIAVKGFFYGITVNGGKSGNGLVYKITPSGTQSVVYEFKGGLTDGRAPNGPLTDVGGVLYGTTSRGGTNDSGVFLSLTTSGTEKVLYNFGSSASPFGPLLYDSGVFFGTETGFGSNLGSVYKITAKGAFKTVYAFQGLPDCNSPKSGVIVVKNVLYGAAFGGGSHSAGCIFRIKAGKERVLYSFKGGKDAQTPYGGLTAVNGTLYGTGGGGAHSQGTVFKVSLLGKERVLYSFAGYPNDASSPNSPLLYIKGAFYSVAASGGRSNNGAVFKVDGTGHETVLYAFKTRPDGADPAGALIDYGGRLYDTTSSGGKYGFGTVFSL